MRSLFIDAVNRGHAKIDREMLIQSNFEFDKPITNSDARAEKFYRDVPLKVITSGNRICGLVYRDIRVVAG
jgi:hypothetical protein